MSQDNIDRNKLVTDNLKLAQAATSALRCYYPANTYEDFLSVAYIGLCEAANSYDSQKGAFSTWAYSCIKYQIYEELEKTYKHGFTGGNIKGVQLVNDGEIVLEQIAVEDEYAETELRCAVQRFLKSNYPDYCQEVLQLLENGYDYQTIGYLVAKEPSYLRSLVSEIRKKMKQQILYA